MADWPADGVTNWNTKMKANIDVGHDSDGTHKKSQMLTDMGWSPTAYTGGETVTFPNGLIIKSGWADDTGTTTTVTFGTAFPNAFVSAQVTGIETAASIVWFNQVGSTSAIVVRRSGNLTGGFYWMAIGY